MPVSDGNNAKLARLCVQIDKETDWQRMNEFVDEVVDLLDAKKQQVQKLEDDLRTDIEVRAAKRGRRL